MQTRTIRSAPAEHLEDLAYLTAHLKADPRALEIASDVEAESATLKERIEAWTSKRHAVRETQTGLGNMTETLRNAVRHAHDVILDDLRRNRRSPKFLTYFPRGLEAFNKASYLELVTDVRSLVQRCAQDPSSRVQEAGHPPAGGVGSNGRRVRPSRAGAGRRRSDLRPAPGTETPEH